VTAAVGHHMTAAGGHHVTAAGGHHVIAAGGYYATAAGVHHVTAATYHHVTTWWSKGLLTRLNLIETTVALRKCQVVRAIWTRDSCPGPSSPCFKRASESYHAVWQQVLPSFQVDFPCICIRWVYRNSAGMQSDLTHVHYLLGSHVYQCDKAVQIATSSRFCM